MARRDSGHARQRSGRDKVTFVVSPPISTFGYWLEQLLAESTGKEGKGILPVEGEPLGAPEVYGDDRLFVYLRTDDGVDAAQDEALSRRFEAAGQPVVRLPLRDATIWGGSSSAGSSPRPSRARCWASMPSISPTCRRRRTPPTAILQEYEPHARRCRSRARSCRPRRATSPSSRRATGQPHARARSRCRPRSRRIAQQARPGDYVALLAYLPETARVDDTLQQIRARLRDTRRVATTLGYGPRFQHSTGQYFKGGPNTGCLHPDSSPPDTTVALIPGASYSFGTLKQAQALGDWQTLLARGRRAIRIELGSDLNAGLVELRQAMEAIQL